MKKYFFLLALYLVSNLIISQDFAPFQSDGKYGFRVDGKMVISAQFDYVSHFKYGMACAKLGNKWGFLNKKGSWIVKPIYDKVQIPVNGYCKVQKGGFIGLVDSLGNEIVEPKFSDVELVEFGVITYKGELKGFVREGWKEILPDYYSIEYYDGYVSARKNNLYDIYDRNGLVLKEQKKGFNKWRFNPDGSIIATQEGEYGVYNEGGWWDVEPEYGHLIMLSVNEYIELSGIGEEYSADYIYAAFTYSEGDIDFISNSELRKKSKNREVTFILGVSFYEYPFMIKDYEVNKEKKGNEEQITYNITTIDGDNRILNSDMTFTDGPEHILSFNLVKNVNKMDLVNDKDEVVLSADSIVPFYDERLIIYDEIDWEEVLAEKGEVIEIPIVKIYNENESYLFHLNKLVRVSPILPSDVLYEVDAVRIEDEFYRDEYGFDENVYFGTNYSVAYSSFSVSYSMDNKMGLYDGSMNKGTQMDFNFIEVLGDQFVIMQKEEGDKKLIGIVDNIDVVILEVDNVFLSFMDAEFEPDYETFDFLIFTSYGKLGLVTESRLIISGIDHISDLNKSEYLIIDIEGEKDVVSVLDGRYFDCSCTGEFSVVKNKYDEDILRVTTDASLYYIGEGGIKYPNKDKVSFIDDFENENGESLEVLKTFDEYTNEKVALTEPTFYPFEETNWNNIYELYLGKDKGSLIHAFLGEIIPPEYENFEELENYSELYLSSIRTIVAIKNNGKKALYSLKGELISPPEYDEYSYIYDDQGEPVFIKTKINNKIGIITIEGEVFLPPEYRSIANLEDFLSEPMDFLIVENNKRKFGIIDFNAKYNLPEEYSSIQEYLPDWQILEDHEVLKKISKGGKIGIFDSGKGLVVPALYDRIVEEYNEDDFEITEAYFVSNKKSIGIITYEGVEILPCKFTEFTVYSTHRENKFIQIVSAKENGKYYVGVIGLPLEETKPYNLDLGYDLVNDIYGYIYLEKGKMEMYNVITQELIKIIDESEFTMKGIDFDIFLKKGRFGAKSKDGNILIKPIYDSGEFMEGRSDIMIGYENGVMYYIYVESNKRYTENEW